MSSRYRLVQPLATGGMAELFLGVAKGAEGFERAVAIKRVLPHLARESAIADMFVTEARLAMLLQHQNIVTVHDVGEGPEGLFLVMELVDGWDLGTLLRAAVRQGLRIPPHLAVYIVSQAQAGLRHAYRRTRDGQPVMAAHRDLSPSNVLVSREGEVKVTDFGIARLSGLARTEPGAFKGKVPYAAPEVLRGEPATALSDQFSLGIVLSELLAGQHPFGASGDAMATAYSILHRAPASLPDVPASLATLVLRMLSREPEGRFPEPEDVSEALARWLAQSGEPVSSHALATFLRSVRLPPSMGDLARTAEQEAGAKPSEAGVFVVAPAPATSGGTGARTTAAVLPDEEESPWSPSPGGRALSATGEVVHACALCGAALESAEAPCDACTRGPSSAEGRAAAGDPLREAGTARGSGGTPGHPLREAGTARGLGGTPEHPMREAGPAQSPGGTPRPPAAEAGSARGREHPGRAPRCPAVRRAAPVALRPHPPSVSEAGDANLELEVRAPRPASTPWSELTQPEPRPRRRRGLTVALFTVTVVLVGGLLVLWPRIESRTGRPSLPWAPTPTLSIRSEPSGATVLIDGAEMGVTPLSIDNTYPARSVPVQLKLRGYRPWSTSFMGGKKADVDAQLKR